MGREQSATLLMDAPPSRVRAALLAPVAYPAWNPAFVALDGPALGAVGQTYALAVRPGLTGHFSYVTIEPDRVVIRWSVRGFDEIGTWKLLRHGEGTDVVHTFQHSGPLAAILAPSYRGVARLRLQRLAEHLGPRVMPPPL